MKRMIRLNIDEVTLCKRGMNNKEYLIRKHKGVSSMNKELLEAVKKAKFDNESDVVALLEKCADNKEAQSLFDSMVALKSANLPEGGIGTMLKASGKEITISEDKVGELVAKAIKDKEDAEKAEKEAIRKAKAGEADLSDVHNPSSKAVFEFLLKSQKESSGVIAGLQDDVKKAQDKIDKVEKDEVLKKAVERTSVFKHLSISSEDTGKILAKMSPEDGATFEATLKAANNLVKKAGDAVFDEIGSNRPGNTGSTFQKVTKMAEERVSKSDGKQTIEQVRAQIWVDRPELFAAHEAEIAANAN